MTNLDFSSVLPFWPDLVKGALLSLGLATAATILGFLIGTLCAVGRRSANRLVSRFCGAYIEAIRNTPLLVQIFLVYFGLSSMGLRLSAVTVAILSMVINVGAYAAEIMRAGFDSIRHGEIEAAECLGLSRLQVYCHVILLPGLERVYPALTSQFVLMMLASSVCSQISTEELTAVANFVQSETYRPLETYMVVALAYVLLSLLMRAGFAALGAWLFPRRRKLGTAL
jgi:polar amino acid transport system permease protein